MGKSPTIVSYGGGVNSTALLVGIVKGLPAFRPGAILFADTGGELPETYAYVAAFSAWLAQHGLPTIVTVRDDLGGPLEQRCLSRKMLPSVAYGRHRRGCSEKSKQRPQHRWARREWPDSMAAWEAGGRVTKLIGYGAEETYRARIDEDRWYEYLYPLIGWGWDRRRCEEEIRSVGLAPPVKSACFFCPFRKRHELHSLRRDHPDLLERALAMEAAAIPNLQGKTIKGLGGYFAWQDYFAAADAAPMFPMMDDSDPSPAQCVCNSHGVPDDEYEGDEE